MSYFERISENPIIVPNKDLEWKSFATFNPCVVKVDNIFHILYRAQSFFKDHHGHNMSLSFIGYAQSSDGINFDNHYPLIKPEQSWECFGCEDPRVTFLNDKYYIFYTALSNYPFSHSGIKVGLAITKDFKTIEEKHFVTPFNCKAMSLFPEKINGKIVAILTPNTDLPPAKIALAFFEKEEDIWCEEYWHNWYSSLDTHVIPLLRHMDDHIEVGAPPVRTSKGWLVVYSYIQMYFTDKKIFGVEAVLLDLNDPTRVIGKTTEPLLFPEKEYEVHGSISNIIFPSGAVIENDQLYLYYGAADTTCCLAIGNVNKILDSIIFKEKKTTWVKSKSIKQGFDRYKNNPIISPRPEFLWEAKATFNPAAVYEDGKFHIIYRAMSADDTSVFGYASSKDGFNIDERLLVPIYEPRANFEKKLRSGNSGCEDPRITKVGDTFYMFYTAYDGYIPRVAYTSIKVNDFVNKRWNWEYPQVITPPGIDNKDACIFSKKINDKYIFLHRANACICINREDNLAFDNNRWLEHIDTLMKPQDDARNNKKIGLASPPIETKHGWIMLYHRVDLPGNIYKVDAALLDLHDPFKVLANTQISLIEPEMDYEKIGIVNNVVFPCGSVLLNEEIYIYYGGADRVIGVAKIGLNNLLKRLGI